MKYAKIYGLAVCGVVRSVGKTERALEKRLLEHLQEARRGAKSHRCKWLRSLEQPPEIILIEEVLFEVWEARETYWISLFRDYGHRLVNGTAGGEGGATMTGRKMSQEFCAAANLRLNSLPRTPEHCEALRRALRKPETRRKISVANTGRKLTPEQCAAWSARRIGKKHSAETLEKLRLAWAIRRQKMKKL